MSTTQPLFAHILAMTDATGLFEHAKGIEPRLEHGYCVDDVARGLVVLSRSGQDGDHTPWAQDLNRLSWLYLRYLARSQATDGRVVNRCDHHGVRHGSFGVEDCWGRALWGLGTAAGRHRDHGLAAWALARFTVSAHQRSPWLKAMVFAGLGAAEVLRVDPGHSLARSLLADAAAAIPEFPATRGETGELWIWPQPRLTYANAAIPDVLMAAGDALNEPAYTARGLELLDWLLRLQTNGEHLSLTPAGGWGPGDPYPGFDQQPIEASTLADACARAYELTNDPVWARGVTRSAAWFFGANDAGVVMYDTDTGGSRDGLHEHSANENEGAESSLALISTVQHSERLAASAR